MVKPPVLFMVTNTDKKSPNFQTLTNAHSRIPIGVDYRKPKEGSSILEYFDLGG
jgi:hypothetical protein